MNEKREWKNKKREKEREVLHTEYIHKQNKRKQQALSYNSRLTSKTSNAHQFDLHILDIQKKETHTRAN